MRNNDYVLTVEAWRFRLFLLVALVLLVWRMHADLEEIQRNTKRLLEVAKFESDEWPTPEHVEERVEWLRDEADDEAE